MKSVLTELDLPWTICTSLDQEAFERSLWRERSGWQSVWAKPLYINLRISVSASCGSSSISLKSDHSTAMEHRQRSKDTGCLESQHLEKPIRSWTTRSSKTNTDTYLWPRCIDFLVFSHRPLKCLWNCWNQRVPMRICHGSQWSPESWGER